MTLEALTNSRYLIPVGVFLALAVAIGVWLVPGSAFDPGRPGGRTPRVAASEDGAITPGEESVAKRDWEAVADILNTLRVPDPTQPEPKPDVPENGAKPDTPIQLNTPPAPRVTWEYEGYIAQPGRVAALLRIGGEQRFVFEGAPVNDRHLLGFTATLTSVAPERIVVRLTKDGQDSEQTIERSNAAPPVNAPATPNALPPRGKRGNS